MNSACEGQSHILHWFTTVVTLMAMLHERVDVPVVTAIFSYVQSGLIKLRVIFRTSNY